MITIIKKGTSSDEIKKRMTDAFSKAKASQRSILKYAGKLKLEIGPLDYQKKMREEWK